MIVIAMHSAAIFAVILITSVIAQERGERCITPNQEIARCIPVLDCPLIIDRIKSNPSSTDIKFVKESQCGYDTKPLVCCGSSGHFRLQSRTLFSDVLPNRTVCGLDTLDKRIVYGDETKPKEFPWMAALEFKERLRGTNVGIKCGGSVITNRYVLTAAHCITTSSFELIKVWLGEWKISTDPDCEMITSSKSICADPVKKFGIENQIPHPLYNPVRNINDIGVIRLNNDILFTEYIRPICLPTPDIPEVAVLTRMTVAGWGVTEKGSTSDVKLKVEIPILLNTACRNKLKKSITATHLCAGGEDAKDSCRGDSGGPLMRFYINRTLSVAQWFQEGIVSWGVGCAFPDYPAVYTKVSAYTDWIVNTISSSLPPIQVQTKIGGQSNGRIYFPGDIHLSPERSTISTTISNKKEPDSIDKILSQLFHS